MSDCIFCKIANGQIPTDFLFEDQNVVAFRDLNPLTPTHVLVVPKAHHENILDAVPAETLLSITKAVEAVVESEHIRERGFRLVTNTGDEGGQSVHHLHVHVLGGRKLKGDMGEGGN